MEEYDDLAKEISVASWTSNYQNLISMQTSVLLEIQHAVELLNTNVEKNIIKLTVWRYDLQRSQIGFPFHETSLDRLNRIHAK